MKYLIFLLLIVCHLNFLAQAKYSIASEDFVAFHENVSTAERMYKNDSLLHAYAKFDNAFANYQGQVNPGHYFRAALCAIKIKEEFKALDFLEKAILEGYEIDSLKKRDVIFYNQNTKKRISGKHCEMGGGAKCGQKYDLAGRINSKCCAKK